MTLTTTAFSEEEKPVCFIQQKQPQSRDHYMTYELRTEIRTGYKIIENVIMESGNRDDAVRTARLYEQIGECTIKERAKPICYIEEKTVKGDIWNHTTYTLNVEDSLGPRKIKTVRANLKIVKIERRQELVKEALNYEKKGDCIYSVSFFKE